MSVQQNKYDKKSYKLKHDIKTGHYNNKSNKKYNWCYKTIVTCFTHLNLMVDVTDQFFFFFFFILLTNINRLLNYHKLN